MLQLYDVNHVKLEGLTNYKELNIQREINQLDILSFLFPVSDIKYSLIYGECYIRTKENEYVIKEVNTQDDNWTQYVCKVNIEDIKGMPVSHFEAVEQLCTDSVNLALAGTGWTIGSCDVTKKRTVRKNNCNAYDVMQEIQSAYGCEMTFDSINKKAYIYQSMGNDKGTYFAEQLNLKKLDKQSNTYDYITRLILIGKDGLGIANINGGKNYVENYQYSNKIITAYWEDNRYTVTADLLEDGITRLDYLSKPCKAYKADVYDLANSSEEYKDILDFSLGDTITLLSKSKNVKEKQRIIKLTEYSEEPKRNTVEIANRIARLEDLNVRFIDTSDTVDSVTTSAGELDGTKVDGIDWNKLQNVHIMVADIEDMSVVTARIGTLETTTATITQLNAQIARVDNLTANKANVTDLTASNGRITTLESKAATIDTLLAGNLSVANMQAGFITADCGLIANGAIKDAMIDTISVNKVLAGDISTTKFRIVSDSGKMLISDNAIQIKDASRVRVQIGKDASNDYNMYVWDSLGNLMFDATGLKASGIKNKIIRDDMVSDTANINGSKIEKESLVTQINGATTTLKASKIKLDTENQTLDVAFTSLKSTVTSQGTTITSQGTSITTIQGQITNKIWSTDITTAQNNLQGQITTINTNYSALNQTVNDISANISSLQTTTTSLGTRMTSAESSITANTNAITLKASQSSLDTTNGNVSSLTTRMTTAEASITTNANNIALKVTTTTYNTGMATKEGTITKASTAPTSPTTNQLWLDTSVTPNQLKRYSGTVWVKATPSAAGEVGAYSSSDGSALAGRVTTAESTLTVQAGQIASKVNVNGVISAINQTAESIKIQASKIDLTGFVTFSSLSTPGSATIDGGNIKGSDIVGVNIKTASANNYVHLTDNIIEMYQTWTNGAGAYNGVPIQCFSVNTVQVSNISELYLQAPDPSGALREAIFELSGNGLNVKCANGVKINSIDVTTNKGNYIYYPDGHIEMWGEIQCDSSQESSANGFYYKLLTITLPVPFLNVCTSKMACSTSTAYCWAIATNCSKTTLTVGLVSTRAGATQGNWLSWRVVGY